MFECDELKIYRGGDIQITPKIIVIQPTLDQIERFGEKRYFNAVHTLTAVGADLKWQLWDFDKIDYTKIEDYDLFIKFISQLVSSKKKVYRELMNNPDKYAHYLHISHPPIITFGATFLMLLFLTFFMNHNKEVHWFKWLEDKLALLGKVRGLNVVLTLIMLFVAHNFVSVDYQHDVLVAGIWGIVIYLLVDGVSSALEAHADKKQAIADCSPRFNFANSCFINFLYLELIDASFSFLLFVFLIIFFYV